MTLLAPLARYPVTMRTCLILLLPILLGACVDRRISVTSDPPGARVWINDTEVGTTPVQTAFRFYGVYDIRLEKDGYEPIHESRKASPPLYEYPGLDLATGLVPLDWKSRVDWQFTLQPALENSQDPQQFEDTLLQRAHETRALVAGDEQDESKPPLP